MLRFRFALLAFLTSSLAGDLTAAGGGGWAFENASDGSKPTPRHEAAYVEIGGKFYLMGGRGSRPVEEYDPATQKWTDLGNPPLQMHHFQPVAFDGKVYAVCAFEGSYPNETPVPNVWVFDPSLNSWTMSTLIPAGRNRGAAGAVVYDDKIWIVGGNTLGHNGGYVSWLDCYDPVTEAWTSFADAPHARDHFTAAVVGNKLIAAGGRLTDLPNPFDKTIAAVDVYDFTSGVWGNMPEPIPTQRAGTMTVARAEHVIVVGGETSSQAHAETEALDVGTGEWVTLPALIDSRHSGGMVIWQDELFVASGAGNNGGGPELDTQERLDLAGLLSASPTNLLTNADFDNGPVDWEDQGDLALDANGNIAAPALDIANGWAGNSAAATEFETYRLSGAYKVFGTTGDVEIALDYLDGLSVKIGGAVLPVGPTSDYTSFLLDGTTPAGTQTIRARFEAGGDRTLRIDDLVLMEKPAEIARLGAPANPWVLDFSTNGPTGGLTFDPSIDHTDFLPAATQDVLAIGFLPINFPSTFGTVLIDIVSPFFLMAAPGDPLLLPIPLDSSIVGIPFYVQGASISATETLFTNALDLTIQAP